MSEKCPQCGKKQQHEQKANWSCECGATVHGSIPKQASNDRAFDIGWSVVKGDWHGPQEKTEEGKRMVEGDKVFYGQRKWDNVVLGDLLGYIDEEGNERRHNDALYDKYRGRYPDINIAYHNKQTKPEKGEKPFTWSGNSQTPQPATTRERLSRVEMESHRRKLDEGIKRDWERRFLKRTNG